MWFFLANPDDDERFCSYQNSQGKAPQIKVRLREEFSETFFSFAGLKSSKKQILVTHADIPSAAIDLLKTKCDVTVMNSGSSDEKEVLKLINEYDGVLGKFTVDEKFLDAAGSRLKVISTPSAGYDHLDIPEIKKRGIRIGHTPYISSAAVAEIAIYLLLGAARRTFELRLLQDQGKVKQGFQCCLGKDLRGATIGIVGLGSIGVEIIKRLKCFEIKNFVYTAHKKKSIGDQFDGEFVTMDKLLKVSDFIINCLPLNPETDRMFNDDMFKKMKPNTVFVNVGRGRTVDTDAIVKALKNKTIFAAGLDVTDPEPLPVNHELLNLENAVLTPHIGSQTITTRKDMAIVAAQNILNALEDKPLLYEL